MATTISKFRPDHPSLDFERLREEGIQHLESLATEVWTDFNAHDPGITILEVLCYAITDLGYRTRLLPIGDLVAGASATFEGFKIADVLPAAPVTALDLRKILIDLEGVKNAWVEAAPGDVLFSKDGKNYGLDSEKLPDSVDANGNALPETQELKISETNANSLKINGLIKVILELEDDLDPRNPADRNPVLSRVSRCLHANRSLCTDFLAPDLVEEMPVAVCLDLELEPGANEQEAMAQAAFNLQNLLTPAPRFYSFQEMRAKGYPIEKIANGPLLSRGFLDDAELQNSRLHGSLAHADLLETIGKIPGLRAIRDFRLATQFDPAGNPKFSLGAGGLHKINDVDPLTQKLKTLRKPVIDLQKSCFFYRKGIETGELKPGAFKNQLAQLNLLWQCQLPQALGLPEPLPGKIRPDLADYRSIQFEFPDIYRIGDNQVLDSVPPLRKAQQRQLQAFLTFFDQILGGYLLQLDNLKNLFSMQQAPDSPMAALPLLFEVPGVRELLENQAKINAPKSSWVLAAAKIAEEAERAQVIDFLKVMTDGDKVFIGFSKLREAISKALPDEKLQKHVPTIADHFWAEFVKDEKNNLAQSIRAIAETPEQQKRRKNRLLNHLIARFGEAFSEFAVTLLRADARPEDNPFGENFAEYLKDKVNFLREIPALAAGRGLGFNYRKFDHATNKPDVWNTRNVSGVQKRVSRLVGIENWETRSLIAAPPYEIALREKIAKSGKLQYFIELKKRKYQISGEENPVKQGVAMVSKPFPSRSAAEGKRTWLYQNIWKTGDAYGFWDFTEDPDDADNEMVVVREAKNSSDWLLRSDIVAKPESESLMAELKAFVSPGSSEVEGFHVLEHILLRPDDLKDKDALLEIPIGCPTAKVQDPYSFRLTVVLPGEGRRFGSEKFRDYFEQIFRAEAPAHIAVCFAWLSLDEMYRFEPVFKNWLEAKAKCRPDDCNVSEAAKKLIDVLKTLPFSCCGYSDAEIAPKCDEKAILKNPEKVEAV